MLAAHLVQKQPTAPPRARWQLCARSAYGVRQRCAAATREKQPFFSTVAYVARDGTTHGRDLSLPWRAAIAAAVAAPTRFAPRALCVLLAAP